MVVPKRLAEKVGANSEGSFLLQLDRRVLIGLLGLVYMLTKLSW